MSLQDYDMKKIGLLFMGLLIFVLALVGTGTSIFFYNKYKDTETKIREASVVSREDVQALVAKVGKLMKLPEGELPTVATVTDVEKLKDQPFFARAKVGDKVLLYTQAKKAILYDPVDNLIVEVGPLIIPTMTPAIATATESGSLAFSDVEGVQTKNVSPSPSPARQSVNVAVLNGTTTGSVLDKFIDDLEKNAANAEIVSKGNAANRNYAKTIIIDISGNKKGEMENLAGVAKAEISALPSNEQAPDNADFLIILGNDRLSS